jgi:hypothetical protein
MIDKLLALKSLVIPDRSQPAHEELDHSHWDAVSRTWRAHRQPTAREEADSAESNLSNAS